MASTLPVDMELKKAFQELQKKMVDSTQSIKVADIQIEGLKRSIQHAKLTEAEVNNLPKDVRLYEGVGRMFIQQDLKSIKETLENQVTKSEDRIIKLENNKKYLENDLKESSNNIREMISSKAKK